jgi:hypothetical protein
MEGKGKGVRGGFTKGGLCVIDTGLPLCIHPHARVHIHTHTHLQRSDKHDTTSLVHTYV